MGKLFTSVHIPLFSLSLHPLLLFHSLHCQLRQHASSGGERSWWGRTGLQAGHEHPQQRPFFDGGRWCRSCQTTAGRRRWIRADPRTVRSAHRAVPADQGKDCEDGDRCLCYGEHDVSHRGSDRSLRETRPLGGSRSSEGEDWESSDHCLVCWPNHSCVFPIDYSGVVIALSLARFPITFFMTVPKLILTTSERFRIGMKHSTSPLQRFSQRSSLASQRGTGMSLKRKTKEKWNEKFLTSSKFKSVCWKEFYAQILWRRPKSQIMKFSNLMIKNFVLLFSSLSLYCIWNGIRGRRKSKMHDNQIAFCCATGVFLANMKFQEVSECFCFSLRFFKNYLYLKHFFLC